MNVLGLGSHPKRSYRRPHCFRPVRTHSSSLACMILPSVHLAPPVSYMHACVCADVAARDRWQEMSGHNLLIGWSRLAPSAWPGLKLDRFAWLVKLIRTVATTTSMNYGPVDRARTEISLSPSVCRDLLREK
jgi:hypothetical protein